MPALKLFWESVPNAVSYTVYWSTSPGVTTSTGIPISGITNVIFHHTDLLENTTYYYIVVAVDGAGNLGPASAEFSALTSAISGLSIVPANTNIGVGITQAYMALVTYSDGYSQDVTLNTTWDTDNHSVATIDGSGLLTGVAVGTAHVQGTYLTSSASTPITVSHTLVSIAISPLNLTINAQATQQYTAIGHYNDLTTSDLTPTVTWQSSDLSAATISVGGLATGIGGGTTTITATSGLISNSTTLTVTPVLQHLIISATVYSNLTNSISISDSTLTTNSISGFTSSGILLIDGEQIYYSGISGNTFTGLIRGYGGTTATTHGAGSVVAQYVGTIYITYPDTAQATATGNFTDDSTTDVTNSVTWSSDTPSVVTIDNTGYITTHHHGTAIITATIGTIYGSVSASVSVIVSNVLASITVSPASVNLYFSGNTSQFSALGTYNDGDTASLTGSVAWHSSNTSVATIAAGGLLTAVASGSTNITATSGTVTSNTAVATFSVWTNESFSDVAGDKPFGYVIGYDDTHIMAGGQVSGAAPLIVKWNGSAWSTVLRGPGGWPGNGTGNPIVRMKVSPDGTTWFAHNLRSICKSTNFGTSWTACTDPSSGGFVNAIGIVDANTIWTYSGVGGTNAFKYSTNGGSSWTTHTTPSDSGNVTINDFWIFNSNDIFAVGNHSGVGVVWHYNGTAWTQTSPWTTITGASGAPMSNIFTAWGTSASDMYIGGTTSFVSSTNICAMVHSTDMFNTITLQTFLGGALSNVSTIYGTTTFSPLTLYAAGDVATSSFRVYAYQPGISTANQWVNAGTIDGNPGAASGVWVNGSTGRAVAVGGSGVRVETNNPP